MSSLIPPYKDFKVSLLQIYQCLTEVAYWTHVVSLVLFLLAVFDFSIPWKDVLISFLGGEGTRWQWKDLLLLSIAFYGFYWALWTFYQRTQSWWTSV